MSFDPCFIIVPMQLIGSNPTGKDMRDQGLNFLAVVNRPEEEAFDAVAAIDVGAVFEQEHIPVVRGPVQGAAVFVIPPADLPDFNGQTLLAWAAEKSRLLGVLKRAA
jgi:hypothetical protein